MKHDQLNDRIGYLFTRQSSRHALFMAGSVAISYAFGAPVPELIDTIHHGFGSAISNVPFAPSLEAINAYFDGALTWLSATGTGIASWADGVMDHLESRNQALVSQMHSYLGDKAAIAKSYFDATISKSAEFVSFWRATLKDAVPQDPMSLLAAAGRALTSVAETFGVAMGLKEAYCWAVRKVRGEPPKEAMANPTSITNLHVNISLAGAGDVSSAVEKIAMNLADTAAAGKSIIVDQTASAALGPNAEAVIDTSQVMWVSRELSDRLRAGVARSLEAGLMVDQKEVFAEGIKRTFRPLQDIHGGLVYRVTPKGQLCIAEPESAKIEIMTQRHSCTMN